MKVILLQDIKSLGEKGEVKEVADGYARNYLFTKDLAVAASAGNLNSRDHEIRIKEDKEARDLAVAKRQAGELADKTVIVYAKSGEMGKLFGSITTGDLASALAQMGFKIDKKKIELTEQIKSLGSHQAVLKLYPNVRTDIAVEVKDESER